MLSIIYRFLPYLFSFAFRYVLQLPQSHSIFFNKIHDLLIKRHIQMFCVTFDKILIFGTQETAIYYIILSTASMQ